MERNPAELRPKTESIKDRIERYFLETDIETHTFTFVSYEKAKEKVDEINTSYEGIAFVAKDGDRFVVKFRTPQLGEGITEYNPNEIELEEVA